MTVIDSNQPLLTMSDRPPLPPGRLTPLELQNALLAGTGQGQGISSRAASPSQHAHIAHIAQLPPMAPFIPQQSIVAEAPAKKKKTSDMRFTEQEHHIFLDSMEEVFQLNFQIFPLTKNSSRKKK